MSYSSEYKKFYKVLKKKVTASVSKKTKSLSSKGSLQKKSPTKPSHASTSQDTLENDLFSGPITQINVILEDSSSESEDEVIDLVKCEYCLKKFASRNKLYMHKLCHLSLPVEKLILPTLEDSIIESVSTRNKSLEMTVLNQSVPMERYLQNRPGLQHHLGLQHVTTLQQAQLPMQPNVQRLPQIPNVQLFVQHSMPAVQPLLQVMQHNVPQLQLPVPPLINLQPLQNVQQPEPPRKKNLIEVNGFTFEEWDENNTLAGNNMLHEEIMLPSDIKEEIKTEPPKPTEEDNINLQQPATVATSDNEPDDPLAIDEPMINQQALPMVGNVNQTDPLAINQINLNYPLQLNQLVAIPMEGGQVLIAAQLPSAVDNLSVPQKVLVPLGNILSGAQLPIGDIATGAQLPNVATPQPLPIVVNQSPLLSLNNVTQKQQMTINDVATQQQNLMLPVTKQKLPLPINSVVNTQIENMNEDEKEIDFMEKELNSLMEKEQTEKIKKQELLIKRKILKECSRKEKKDLCAVLRETAFAINEDMVGAKQRRRRRPGVGPRQLRKGELQAKMLAEKAKAANTSTEKTITTKACAEKTVVEKVIANIDLTDTDETQRVIPAYTPTAFVGPGPSCIPGSAKLPGSWDKKPNTTSGSWNKSTNPSISHETGRLNNSVLPLKNSFLEALLKQKSRPLESMTLKGMVQKNVPTKTLAANVMVTENVPSKTFASKTGAPETAANDKSKKSHTNIRNNKVTPKTASKTSLWNNMTLKDMIETTEPTKKVPWETKPMKDMVERAVTPETSKITMVGNLNTTICVTNEMPNNNNEINKIPLRYDKLIKASKLYCMYCNQFCASWYNLISHMRQHLKVTLSRIEKCIICTRRYCTKEGGKFCYECVPFYKEVQDKYDLTFDKQRKNLKFVKLYRDLDEPECILEDTNTNCELEDPLGTICTKVEPLEDIGTNMAEQNKSRTNVDNLQISIEMEKDNVNDSTEMDCEGSMEDSISTNIDIFDENVSMENSGSSKCTNSDSEDSASGTNIDSNEANDSCTDVDSDENNSCTKINFEENYTCTNIPEQEENDACVGTKLEKDTCTKKKSRTKIDPFKEKDATLLQYCEACYKFGSKLTDCGIKNYVYKYKCVDEMKYSNKLLECNKCGGRFTSVKYVVRFISRKNNIIKVKKPAYNIAKMLRLQNEMTILMISSLDKGQGRKRYSATT